MLEKLKAHYSMTSPASVYDEEALTALELAGRTAAKVNEVVDAQNNLEQETDARLNEQNDYLHKTLQDHAADINHISFVTMPQKVEQEIAEKVNDGTFDAAIDNYAGNLTERLDNFFANTVPGSTNLDAELIDMRVDALNNTHYSAGTAVRTITGDLYKRLNAISKFETTPVEPVETSNMVVNKTGENLAEYGYSRLYNVKAGEQYLVTSYYGFAIPDVVFMCEDKLDPFIGYAHTNDGEMKRNKFTEVINVPFPATQMRVNWANNAGEPELIQVRKITGYRADFSDYEWFIDESLKPLRGLMPIYTDLEPVQSKVAHIFKRQTNDQIWTIFVDSAQAALYRIQFYNVLPGQRIRINSAANFGNVQYFLFNSQSTGELDSNTTSKDIFLYVEAGTGDTVEYRTDELIVPIGADCVGVSYINGTPDVEVVSDYDGVKPWNGLTCLCIGDSLTEANETAALKYHDHIHAKTGLQIINQGVSGRGIMRGYDTNTNYMSQVVKYTGADPDVILIMASGNDNQYIRSKLGDVDDAIGDNTYCGYFNQLINLCMNKHPRSRICVISSPPWKGSHPTNVDCGMDVMSRTLKAMCERWGIPFLDLYRCAGINPELAGHINAYYKNDKAGVHPDADGHKVLASPICAFLESVIGCS